LIEINPFTSVLLEKPTAIRGRTHGIESSCRTAQSAFGAGERLGCVLRGGRRRKRPLSESNGLRFAGCQQGTK